MKSPRTIVLLSALFWCESVFAAITYPLLPENISDQIKSRGTATIHNEIFSDPLAANMLLLALDSGRPDWLQVAELFLEFDNPASRGKLIMAIGEALQWAPENIFEFESFPLAKICSLDGLYEWRRFSRFLAETAIERRIESLTSLDGKNFSAQKSTCLQVLANTRRKIQMEMDDFVSGQD